MSARGRWLLLASLLAFAGGCGTILGFEDPTLQGGSGGAPDGSSGQGIGGHAGDTDTSGGTAGRATGGGSGEAGMQTGGEAGAAGTSVGGETGVGGTSETGGANGQAGTAGTAGTAGMGGGAGGSAAKGCGVGHVIISQVRSRGASGAADEFVELYNATSAAVTLDASWNLDARSYIATSFAVRWAGTGKMVEPYGHFLIVGSSYTQSPSADAQLASTGLSDASSVRLLHNNTPVDVVCIAYSASSTQALSDVSFQCPGAPANNVPHNDATAGNIDQSLVRKTGGGTARCLDTGDNANDFTALAPAAPRNLASMPTP